MSTSKPLRVPRFVGLLLSFALFVLTLWGLRSWRASRPAEELENPGGDLVKLPQTSALESPQTLGNSIANGAIAELELLVAEARQEMLRENPSTEFGSRAEFEERYQRHNYSAIGSLLETPELAQAKDLVRSMELNPNDVQFPAQALEDLERLVSAYQGVIVKAVELRDIESNHRTIRLASSEGLLSVESLRDRMPANTREELSGLARAEDPTEGEKYAQVLLAFEARYFQELLNADVALLRGGAAYLAPEGSVLPGLGHYKDFVTEQAVAMIYDVLEFFSRQGTIDGERLDELLASLDEVIEADPL